ncbi:MAG: glycerophosphodiester phosphodiesterase family protein [Planctomycetota bacterium]
MQGLAELRESARPWVIAHRGYSRRFPENTIAAFAAAVDAGADMIELDVRLSSDGVPVVIHDDTVDRTTAGGGPVVAHTVAELKRLGVPSLEEVFQRIRIPINIELKRGAPTDDVVALVRRLGVEDQCLLSSFDLRLLAPLDLPVAALFERSLDDAVGECRACGAIAGSPNVAFLQAGEVSRLNEAGLRVLPYTVNDAATMRMVIEWGAGGMFTDEPQLLREVLA